MKQHTCNACGGTGIAMDQDNTAAEMRALREKAGIAANRLAAALLVSPAYLSDLEHGNRRWTAGFRDAYRETLEYLVKQAQKAAARK